MHNMTKVCSYIWIAYSYLPAFHVRWRSMEGLFYKVTCKAQHQHHVAVTWETRGFPLLPHYHEGRTDMESSFPFFCAVSQGFTQSFLLTAHWPGLITCPNCWVGSLVNGKPFGHRCLLQNVSLVHLDQCTYKTSQTKFTIQCACI